MERDPWRLVGIGPQLLENPPTSAARAPSHHCGRDCSSTCNNSLVRRAKGRRQHRARRGPERFRTLRPLSAEGGLYLRRQGSAKGSPFHKAGRSRFQGATHSVEEMAGAVWAHWDGGPHRPPREEFDVPRTALSYEYIRNGAITPFVGWWVNRQRFPCAAAQPRSFLANHCIVSGVYHPPLQSASSVMCA